MHTTNSPLLGPPPARVALTNPPLVRVIAQVRFPLIASIESQAFIAPFQEAIRGDYPVLRADPSPGVVLGTQGAAGVRSTAFWRFHSTNDVWLVSLTPYFMALETTKYTNRGDFLDRFKVLLGVLQHHIHPRVIDRLGVRYINRMFADNLENLTQWVHPALVGVLGTPLAQHARLAMSESVFDLPEPSERVTMRWGLVPPHKTTDPGLINAVAQQSWLLDLDAFYAQQRPFAIDAIVHRAQGFTERIYRLFRWAITDAFLKQCGGKL